MEIIDYYSKNYIPKKNFERKLEHRELIAFKIIKNLRIGNDFSILDIGCGTGFFLKRLSEEIPKGCSLFGLDYSTDQIITAKSKYPFSFNQCNVEEGLPFTDNKFDIVYAGELVEHLYNPDFFITEVFRILKHNGYLLMTTPNLNSWINRIFFIFGFQPMFVECSTKSSNYGYGFIKRFKKQDWPVGHVRIFNKKSITDILEDNGFNIRIIKGAVFEYMLTPFKIFDKFFTISPSLSSDLVVLAKKTHDN